jgi:hypothetical protein
MNRGLRLNRGLLAGSVATLLNCEPMNLAQLGQSQRIGFVLPNRSHIRFAIDPLGSFAITLYFQVFAKLLFAYDTA